MEIWRDRKQWKGKGRRSRQQTRVELKANDERHAKQRKHSEKDRFVDTSSDRETGKRSLIVLLFFSAKINPQTISSRYTDTSIRSKRKTRLTTGLDATIGSRRPTATTNVPFLMTHQTKTTNERFHQHEIVDTMIDRLWLILVLARRRRHVWISKIEITSQPVHRATNERMAKAYDYLFKLLLIGKWTNVNLRSSIQSISSRW